ncbi:MGMT family protein [Candidatus Woesebacteria bacterium]|nr:MGMT family protein [Candidatus Woesebacteria bacterium]
MKKSIFKNKVYDLCNQIPKGKVVTYGQLASMAGSPGAARAVGMCMKTNPNAPHTPCHRVVASNGKLTGYSGGNGVSTKKEMLIKEGVSFVGDTVNLAVSGWNPS